MTTELEPFILQARSQRSMCVSIIQRVISHRKIFLFGELLQEPNIQALQGTENSKAFNTLELFAYGTYGTYLGLFSF